MTDKVQIDRELLDQAVESLAMFGKKLQPQINGADDICFTVGLKQQITFEQMVVAAQTQDKLRAVLNAPQQEAVAVVLSFDDARHDWVIRAIDMAAMKAACRPDMTVPLYTHPAPSVPEGWQPIETAPKDGTEILVYTKQGDFYVVCYDDVFAAPWRIRNDEWLNEGVPTHWAPLPPEPGSAAPKAPTTDDRKDAERFGMVIRAMTEDGVTLENGDDLLDLLLCAQGNKAKLLHIIDAAIAAQNGEPNGL